MSEAASDFWAITTYFNPAGYERRRLNYGLFRKHLKPPLLTVELAFDGDFELGPGDALFIPVGWWHHVRALEPNVTTNAVYTHLACADEPAVRRLWTEVEDRLPLLGTLRSAIPVHLELNVTP